MTEHWTVAALGEDLGERDPYEIIQRLRGKITGLQATVWLVRDDLAACVTARDEAAVAYAAEMKRLEDGIRGEIAWHEGEARKGRTDARGHETAADRLYAILKLKPEPEIAWEDMVE